MAENLSTTWQDRLHPKHGVSQGIQGQIRVSTGAFISTRSREASQNLAYYLPLESPVPWDILRDTNKARPVLAKQGDRKIEARAREDVCPQRHFGHGEGSGILHYGATSGCLG